MPSVRTDLITRSRYSQAAGIQRIIPAAVARPTDEEELIQILHWAADHRLGVTPRGAGSAMDGSCLGPGLVIDCSALNHRMSLDMSSQSARVGCSLSLGTLDNYLVPHGLRFGPDPSSADWATVGGTIGTNAAGARSYRLGPMSAWVNGLRLLTDDGPLVLERGVEPDSMHPVIRRWRSQGEPVVRRHQEAILSRWPRTRKNTAGYGLHRYFASDDLIDLVIGAEGTVGIVTEATLRLEPMPPCRASLRVQLSDRHDLLPVIEALDHANPTTIELLDRTFLRFVAPSLRDIGAGQLAEADALLLVDLEGGNEDELAARIDSARARLTGMRIVVDLATRAEEITSLWSIRHQASPLLAGLQDGRASLQVIEDGCVPRPMLARYLAAIEAITAREGVDVVMFGHAGDGHVHVNLLPDLRREEWESAVRRIYDAVFHELCRLGGTPAGEHGAGRLRSGLLPRLLGAPAMAAFDAIKAAFDPAGRFNPGVMTASAGDPFSELKHGGGAASVPAGVAEELAAIESGRRYGESRWPD